MTFFLTQPDPTAPCKALAAVATGLCVLFSWASGFAPFKDSFLASISMNPMSAVGFILAGSCLSMQNKLHFRFATQIATALSLAVIFLAALKLASFAGFDVAIDRALFRASIDTEQKFPNRMAPNAAINFLFIGFSLFFLRTKTRKNHYLSDYFVIPPILISLMGTVGYLYSSVALMQVGSYILIAFNTTLTFLALSLGILFSHLDDGIISVNVVNKLEETIERKNRDETERRMGRLKRFFPPAIANMIASGEVNDPFKWHRTDVTVIFIDIRGFTSYAEFAEPEDVMQTLQEYYSSVLEPSLWRGNRIGLYDDWWDRSRRLLGLYDHRHHYERGLEAMFRRYRRANSYF